MNADLLIRDTNGNTLFRTEMKGVPYEGFAVTEAHVSDAGSLVVTIELHDDESA